MASSVRENLPLILASTSPRRKALLEQVGLAFTVKSIDIDETAFASELPTDYVLRLARAKALAAVPHCPAQAVIIAADTTVTIDQHILGKPRDREDAFSMWQQLSGRVHQVITGVAVVQADKIVTCSVSTDVEFSPLSLAQMQDYWASGEPIGKAGGYAIQGRGAAFIPRISGSYSNVVGLPLVETLALLDQIAALSDI